MGRLTLLGAGKPSGGGGGSSYVGPGDVTGWSGAYAYFGMRAYNAAKPALLVPAIEISANDTGSGFPTDIHVKADGSLNLAEVTAWKTAHAGSFTNIYITKW
jgi:hypothetical protein